MRAAILSDNRSLCCVTRAEVILLVRIAYMKTPMRAVFSQIIRSLILARLQNLVLHPNVQPWHVVMTQWTRRCSRTGRDALLLECILHACVLLFWNLAPGSRFACKLVEVRTVCVSLQHVRFLGTSRP
jgi:hypothetical protein